jgi:predicted RNA-binding protein YlqC (UPF0109 family)
LHWLRAEAQPTEQVAVSRSLAGRTRKRAGGRRAAEGEDAQGEEGRRKAEPRRLRPPPFTVEASKRRLRRGGRVDAPAPKRPGTRSRAEPEATETEPRSDYDAEAADDVEDATVDDADEFEDDDDEFEDEIGGEGNRVTGARAKTVVELVARQLVDDPDGVFVDSTERSDNVSILIHTSPGDLGRIIGKRGRVIQALRQVGRAAGATENVRVTVEVAE